MRKHGGTPSWRDKHVTLAAISPSGVARGRFVGGQQSGLAGSKPPPLFTREASSCSSQGRRQGEPWGASQRPSAPTYLPLFCFFISGLLCTTMRPADHVQILDKQRNTGDSIQIPEGFWSGMPAADNEKVFTATVESWEPSYKWPKGKIVAAFRVSVDHDKERYYLSEQQYRQYAADAAVWTMLAEQKKPKQAQLAKAEEQAETGISHQALLLHPVLVHAAA